MYGKSEIGDQFRTDDEYKDRDNSKGNVSIRSDCRFIV